MVLLIDAGKFETGKVVITPRALAELPQEDVFLALIRHSQGDWGELDEFDWRSNDKALDNGRRLLSRYRSDRGIVFWIITEHDRSITTILLPLDY